MEFVLQKRNYSVNDDALIKDIKNVASMLNKNSLAIKEYDAKGMFSSTTIIRRFGSWNKALDICGLEHKNDYYSEDEMLSNIRETWLRLGKQPTRRNMDKKMISKISSSVYLRHFGTWYNAMECFVQWIKNNDKETDNIDIPNQSLTDNHTTKRTPTDRLKVLVLMRDGNRCRLCGKECNEGLHNIHFDHIVPWSKGGETTLDNLQVLCSVCNEAKGNTIL